MGGLSATELTILLVIVLVLFGGSKLPQLARNLGQAQKEFKTGLKEGVTEDDSESPESSSDTSSST